LLSQLGKDGLPEQAYSDADGRYIVFQSARQLLPQDTNGSEDVYLYRVQEEELLLASKSVEGLVGNAGSQEPAMDAHGSYVVFSSLANNLVEGDSNGVSDIYLYYTDFDYLTRVSLSADGELSKPSRRPALDANGVQLLYEYGEDGSREILVADPLQPDLGSRLASPDSAQGDHHHPGISPNGRYATWISESRDGCTLTIQDRIEGSAWQQTCPFGEGVERIDSPWFDEKKESPAILWRTTYADESVMEYRVEHE
jgi:Tol biopolymer transport system component